MKRYTFYITAGLLATAAIFSTACASTPDERAERAATRAEQRTDRHLDRQVDEGVDRFFNRIFR